MIKFSKYHGCGNSFVIVRENVLIESMQKEGLLREKDLQGTYLLCEDERLKTFSSLAKKLCDVSVGVGADGLIVVREEPALEMIFFNRDGSRAPMCGNGIRCFAHYCYDEDICRDKISSVKTLAGEMIVDVTCTEPFNAKINMGRPVFSPAKMAIDYDGENFLEQQIVLEDETDIEINSVFMGTIHTVVFTRFLDEPDVEMLGKEICEHPLFREKTNVNFVEVIDDRTLIIKTYERGVGMTLACGTGACASVIIARLKGFCGSKAEVMLPLGSLMIDVHDDGDVYMEGPAAKICEGELFLTEMFNND